MKRVITIQHTQSEQHKNGMIGSWFDWDLTDVGISQAQNIANNLYREFNNNTFSLYSSDLKRAAHTAKIISERMNISVKYCESLREFYLGEAVGKSKTWAKENHKCDVWVNMVDWACTKDGRVFDGAESREDVWNRVTEFVNQVIVPSKNDLIIVSHDGTLSILFAIWLGLDVTALDHVLISGKTGGVSILCEDSSGKRIVKKLNDMSYLEESNVKRS